MADILNKHSTFHNGEGQFSGIEYCDKCGYSKGFIAATKMECRKPKPKAVEGPKRGRKLILTGVKITYGYWPEKEGK